MLYQWSDTSAGFPWLSGLLQRLLRVGYLFLYLWRDLDEMLLDLAGVFYNSGLSGDHCWEEAWSAWFFNQNCGLNMSLIHNFLAQLSNLMVKKSWSGKFVVVAANPALHSYSGLTGCDLGHALNVSYLETYFWYTCGSHWNRLSVNTEFFNRPCWFIALCPKEYVGGFLNTYLIWWLSDNKNPSVSRL